MAFRDVDYTHSQEELDELRELSLLSYTASHKPRNWRVALLEDAHVSVGPEDSQADAPRPPSRGSAPAPDFRIRELRDVLLIVDGQF